MAVRAKSKRGKRRGQAAVRARPGATWTALDLDKAFEALNEGVYDWNVQTGEAIYSERVLQAIGLTRRQMRNGADWRKRIHKDDLPEYDARIIAHFKRRTPRFECDFRYRSGDGSWRWARQHGIAIRDESGRAVRMVGSTGDITDLKRAEQALQESEQRMSLATQAATEGIYDWDLQTNALWLSERAKQFFGIRKGRLTPAVWNRRVHKDDFARYRQAVIACLKGKVPRLAIEYRIRNAAGGWRWILDHGTAVRDANGRATRLVGAVSDIQRRKQAELEVAQARDEANEALERQTATSEILKVIASSPADVQPVLDAIVQSASRLFSRNAVVRLLGSEGLRRVATSVKNPDEFHGPDVLAADRSTLVGRTILEGKPIQFADSQSADSEFYSRKHAEKLSYRSAAAAPLLSKGTAIGVLGVTSAVPGLLSANHMALLATFADQAVIAIENARLFNETKEALERQTATSEVLREISRSTFDLEAVLRALLDSAMRLSGARTGAMFLPEAEGAYRLKVLTGHGIDSKVEKALRGNPIRPGQDTTTGRALLKGSTVHVQDIQAEPGYRRDLVAASEYRTNLAVPMLRDGTPIGVITLTRGVEVEPFTGKQIELVEGFADQAVIAIENVRLFNETKEALERQTATADILRVISRSPTDVQPVFDAIAASAKRLLGGGAALVARRIGDMLHLAAFTKTSDEGDAVLQKQFPARIVGKGHLGQAILTARPVLISDIDADPAYSDAFKAMARSRGSRSIVSVPMLRDGEAIGVISVNRPVAGKFSDHQTNLLLTFADQAVIAIENVRLFNETKEALERQTATAEVLRVMSGSPTDTKPVFDAIVRSCQRLFQGRAVAFCMPRGEMIETVAFADDGTRGAQTGGFLEPFPLDRGSGAGACILDMRVINVADTRQGDAEFPRMKDLALALGYLSGLFVPLVQAGRALGTIAILRAQTGAYTEREVALAATFADQAVIAIENVRLFNETREALERQTATAEILKVIASSPNDVQPVFDAIAQAAKRLVGAFSVAVLRIVDGTANLAALTWTNPAGDEAMRKLFPRPVAALGGAIGNVTRTRTPEGHVDLQNDPNVQEEIRAAARARGFRGSLAVPMLLGGEVVGVINVTRSEAGHFSDHHIELLKTFADQAVIAIENVRLFNETKESLERQTATAEILKVIASSPSDVQPVFEAIVRNFVGLSRGLFGAVFRFDGKLVHFASAHGFTAEQTRTIRAKYPVTPDDPSVVSSRAILTRAPVVIEDIAKDRHYDREHAYVAGWRRIISVPMLREGAPLGAIVSAWTEPGPIPQPLQDLLKTFADQAVIAIENVRLFNETKEALEHQTATAEVLQVISSSVADAKPVFDKILASCRSLFPDGVVTLGLLDDNDMVHLHQEPGMFVHPDARVRSSTEAVRAAHPRPSRESIYGYVAFKRQLMHFPDVQNGPGVPEGLRQSVELVGSNYSVVYAPLLWEGRGIGALNVGRFPPAPFSEKEIRLLKTFADQAAIAIQNARLFNETKEALERQTATTEILRAISGSMTDLAPVFAAILENAIDLCQGDVAALWIYDGQVLRFAAGRNSTPEAEEVMRAQSLELGSYNPTPQAAQERRTVHVRDVFAEPGYRPLIPAGTTTRRPNAPTVLAVPLLREGQLKGVITIWRYEKRLFSDKQVEMVNTFADQAVIAIENVRLFNETREALERQTATAEILKVMAGSPSDVAPVFDTVAAKAVDLCGGSFGVVTRFDGELIHLAAISGSASFTAVDRIRAAFPARPSSRGAASRCILTREIVHMPDVAADPEYDPQAGIASAAGIRSILAVPLLRGGEPLGSVSVAREQRAPFSEHQIALLKTFADQAVMAIENVRLFKELQSRTEALTKSVGQLTALGEVGQAISGTLDLDTVLKTIVSRAVQLAGLDAGVIYEYDTQNDVFVLRASEAFDEAGVSEFRGANIRRGEGAVGRSVETREPVQVPDTHAPGYPAHLRELLDRTGYRALLAVPLLREEHIVGALMVIRRTPGEFAPEVVELLRTFAGQSALAIQNARLFREIEEKGKQLEVASRHKSNFLASMSHELRTPLNAILGFNEMVLDEIYGEISPDVRVPLENIQTSGRHLLRLINNVLDLAKIEAGRMELALAEYSVHDTVASVHSTLQPLAAEKGLQLLARVPDDVPLAYGDGGRIAQCLMNLAGNSLKFTKAGKVEIAVVQENGTLRYSVADTGIGIPPDKISSLFTEFRQTDATIASEYGGTGLGLSISRKFVEMHGGRIWVESEPGRGSTFIFEVPLRAATS